MVWKNVMFTLEYTGHRGNYPEEAIPLPLSFASQVCPGRIIMCNKMESTLTRTDLWE